MGIDQNWSEETGLGVFSRRCKTLSNLAPTIWHKKVTTKSNDVFEQDFEHSLEAEAAQSSKDEPTTKIVATELINVLADQFTALAEHLQQGFSSLERTMTKAIQTKRKRKSSSSSSSGSGSSDHSEQETLLPKSLNRQRQVLPQRT